MLLPINPEHPEPRKIRRAAEILQGGGVIVYPTDTVYGLGCDLTQKQAIERVYQIKGMQRDKNLAFICPDLADIARYAIVENAAYRVLRRLVRAEVSRLGKSLPAPSTRPMCDIVPA